MNADTRPQALGDQTHTEVRALYHRDLRTGTATGKAPRTAGILFLSGFLLYGVGSAIATDAAGSADRSASLPLGVASMLLNSLVVIGIGILLAPILRSHSRKVALSYLATRIFEGIVLAMGAIALLSLPGEAALRANFQAYNVAMAGLGLGSLFFCLLLFRARLAPPFLALWGFVGYAAFTAGCLLELLGFTGAGLVAAIPGGLFELSFGIWLIVFGRSMERSPA